MNKNNGVDELMKDSYFNLDNPESFTGAYNIIKVAKDKLNVSKNDVENWLKSQDAYTMHKQVIKQFERQKIIVSGIDSQWQIDLTVLPNLAKYNDNFKYLLCCIDVFSKYAWVVPMKTKQPSDIVNAFKIIFQSTDRKPDKICSDAGGEFINKQFQSFLKSNNVSFFTTYSEKKAAVVERFQRTLKQRLWRYFKYANTYRYVDILNKVVNGYNNTYHRTIDMSPISVTQSNSNKIYKRITANLKRGKSQKNKKPKFFVNQPVRINSLKNVFAKGYEGGWSEEIFFIDKIYDSFLPYMYRIRDSNSELIKGRFYEQELQGVAAPKNKIYKIEKILGYKTEKGIKYGLVKWLGYPSASNSWEPVNKIKQI